MREEDRATDKLLEEFAAFESTMRELHLLKQATEDFRSFRRMIRLKRYD